ncbi:ComEA family DNA-binding protein [Paenibacillus shenyangensis]|uniref:ComEA family DNA-binding protein n=1 Tax=Paenibacillus sp. A9 TaxID=1284352 RepID=UPI000A78AEDF|nr:ComEA family DNA-binding protein [Paenibacillus sp. A9]
MKRNMMWIAAVSAVLGIGLICFGAGQPDDQGTSWVVLNERASASLTENPPADQAKKPAANALPNAGATAPQPVSAPPAVSSIPADQLSSSANQTSEQSEASLKSKDQQAVVSGSPTSTAAASAESSAEAGNGTDSSVTGTAHRSDETSSRSGSAIESPASANLAEDTSGRISLNQAGLTELTELPGIGEKKAQAIIDYRNAHGPFRSVSELDNVKGIGSKMLAKLLPYARL